MSNIILTDADDVLLDWVSAFETWMIDQGHKRLPDTDHEYSMAKRFYDLDVKTAGKLVVEFNSSDHMFNLRAYRDSVEYVGKLASLGYKFIVVSAFSTCDEAKQKRMHNLRNLFGDCILDVHGVAIGESKRHILEQNWAGTNRYWIEDHFSNAVAGYEVGLNPILVDTPTNSQYITTLFPRTTGNHPWRDIYEIITESDQ